MSNKLNNSWAKDYSKWEYSPEGIHNKFAGYNAFATKDQEVIFEIALSKLPKKVINLAFNIYFTSTDLSSQVAETFTLRRKSIRRRKAIVILYPRLWRKSLEKIADFIAHEIAHVYLKHEWGDSHSIEKEIEANELASKWIGRKIEYYKKIERKLKNIKYNLNK